MYLMFLDYYHTSCQRDASSVALTNGGTWQLACWRGKMVLLIRSLALSYI